jgi:hypothetical protein
MKKPTKDERAKIGKALLEAWEREYEAGNLGALILAIGYCLNNSRAFPDWVRWQLMRAHRRYQLGNIESWEEVFGKPFAGKTRRHRIKVLKLGHTVWSRVQNHPKPIPASFEYVADELTAEGYKISASSVRDLYYAWLDTNTEFPPR